MEYLSLQGVEFTERNIAEDRDALNDLLALGAQVTPATLIDGDQIVIGFDRKRLDALLGLK